MPSKFTRRALIGNLAAFAAFAAMPARAQRGPALHIVKDPDCGCCTAWARILQAEGFNISLEHRSGAALTFYKRMSGVPDAMASCHTATVDGYVIEGHVPAADIRRLLDERPDAVGLAVPGMPWGSPGMGAESERDAYDVFLIHRDGSTGVFAHYPAG